MQKRPRFSTPMEYCVSHGIHPDPRLTASIGRRAANRVRVTGEVTSKRRGGNIQRSMVTAYLESTLDIVYREITGSSPTTGTPDV